MENRASIWIETNKFDRIKNRRKNYPY